MCKDFDGGHIPQFLIKVNPENLGLGFLHMWAYTKVQPSLLMSMELEPV